MKFPGCSFRADVNPRGGLELAVIVSADHWQLLHMVRLTNPAL